MQRLPPITALRALDAAARHLSFTKAAAELHVTQSAVSHQIKYLEELWDQKLFVRLTRRLELTSAGQALAPVLRDFLTRLEDTLGMLKDPKGRTRLRVWVFPSVALKWLVPRLHGFRQLRPDIDIWIATRMSKEVGFRTGQLDAAFHLDEGSYPDFGSWQLMREYVYPVAHPRVLAQFGRPRTPADLCRFPLLLRTGDDGAAHWEFWFDRAGVPAHVYSPSLRAGTRFSDSATTLEAALEGQGVALARSATVWQELTSGRLIRLFHITCPFHRAIHFICPRDRAGWPAVNAFREWLVAEARKSQREFDAAEMRNHGRGAVPLSRMGRHLERARARTGRHVVTPTKRGSTGPA
jgi:LysR family glycine cleavage system transcriptional activator